MPVLENRYQGGFPDSLGPRSWDGGAADGGLVFTTPPGMAWGRSSLLCFWASAAPRQLCTHHPGDLRQVISYLLRWSPEGA